MRKCINTITCFALTFAITFSLFSYTQVSAYSEDPYIVSGEIYYIKNMYSGQYLDVDHSVDTNGTNILQWPLNGNSGQKWKVNYRGDGYYSLISLCSPSGRALDVYGANTENGGNINLWDNNNSPAQKFLLQRTNEGSYKILSQCSGNTKAVTVYNASCEYGENVFQWEYNATHNDEWIFEPVYNYSVNMGVDYAIKNFNRRLSTYPDISSIGGDCANFVSQCMLAGGVHFQDTWWVYKKNSSYLYPQSTSQLDYSWDMSDPSPWISAKQFNKFWSSKVTVETYRCSYILSNKDEVFRRPFYRGDVIQLLSKNIWGNAGDAWHTMYITDYGYYNGNYNFMLTYHTNDTLNKSLIKICEENPNEYVRFFTII